MYWEAFQGTLMNGITETASWNKNAAIKLD